MMQNDAKNRPLLHISLDIPVARPFQKKPSNFPRKSPRAPNKPPPPFVNVLLRPQ